MKYYRRQKTVYFSVNVCIINTHYIVYVVNLHSFDLIILLFTLSQMQRFNSELKCRSSWSVLCVFSQCHWSVVSSEAVTGQSGNLYWCFYFVIVCIDWNRCSDTTLSADWRNFIGHKLKSGFRGTVLLDHSTASPAWGPVYWLTHWSIDSSGWSLGWLIDRWDS